MGRLAQIDEDIAKDPLNFKRHVRRALKRYGGNTNGLLFTAMQRVKKQDTKLQKAKLYLLIKGYL
jgi:hypothetical protein